jgi:hypothetical protein
VNEPVIAANTAACRKTRSHSSPITSHIVARQHGGGDDSGNLALACYHCNAHKGPNLSGLDPESGALVRLFHPRRDEWDEHFERNGVLIVGRTAVGRATVGLLKMNTSDRRRLRER